MAPDEPGSAVDPLDDAVSRAGDPERPAAGRHGHGVGLPDGGVAGDDLRRAPADVDADEQTREQLAFLFGGVIYRLGDSLLGLRPVSEDGFDEDRTGLDHVSFAVASRAELDDAAGLLDGLGVAHAGVKDIGAGYILEFRDPDDIALELFAPMS